MSEGSIRCQKTDAFMSSMFYPFNTLWDPCSESARDKGSANQGEMRRYQAAKYNGGHIREAHTGEKSKTADLSAQLNCCAIYF